MVALDQNAIILLATISAVSLNSGSKQTLATVPSNITAWDVDKVIMRGASATAATGVASFGGDANASDFVSSRNLTNLNGTSPKKLTLRPDASAATPAAQVEYLASTAFGIKMNTTVNVTVTIEIWGRVRP